MEKDKDPVTTIASFTALKKQRDEIKQLQNSDKISFTMVVVGEVDNLDQLDILAAELGDLEIEIRDCYISGSVSEEEKTIVANDL